MACFEATAVEHSGADSPTPAHAQIFNHCQEENSFKTFPLVPLLPTEIRLDIWRHALQRNRLVKFTLGPVSSYCINQQPRYRVIVDWPRPASYLNKLLYVNAESRNEALKSYRTHVPCEFERKLYRATPDGRTYERTSRTGLLYLNPEYDYAESNGDRRARKATIANFFYYLKTSLDPRHVGLLNIVVDRSLLNSILMYAYSNGTNYRILKPQIRKAFEDTVTQLREVFFVNRTTTWPKSTIKTNVTDTGEMISRALLILTATPTFDRLWRDPRPVGSILEHVWLRSNEVHLAQSMVHEWRQILENDGISESPNVQYRHLLACDPGISRTPIPLKPFDVYDRRSAAQCLREDDEDYGFDSSLDTPTLESIRSAKLKNDDLEQVVKPAFGFWLFPLEAFYAPSQVKTLCDCSQILNLTGYWPELALSDLEYEFEVGRRCTETVGVR